MVPVFFAFALYGQDLPALLSRLTEEAEVYRHTAPQTLAEETLEQRVLAPGGRPGHPHLRTRQIISEYGIGSLKDAPDHPHEFRQVISVDGHKAAGTEKARHALSLGLQSADDRLRKRMLEDLQAHGLAGAAVDFGPLILLFSKRQMGDYRFAVDGATRIGADEAIVLSYRQIAGEQHITVFAGRKIIRLPLEGRVFLRRSDARPLRVTMQAARVENGRKLIEYGAVDYIMTPHGSLAPASVLHRSIDGGTLVAENRFRYTAFRKFSATSEVKSTEVPEVK